MHRIEQEGINDSSDHYSDFRDTTDGPGQGLVGRGNRGQIACKRGARFAKKDARYNNGNGENGLVTLWGDYWTGDNAGGIFLGVCSTGKGVHQPERYGLAIEAENGV